MKTLAELLLEREERIAIIAEGNSISQVEAERMLQEMEAKKAQ